MKIERICYLVAASIGARCAFAARNAVPGPDGVAYLDVANAYLRHDWRTAINGYWGPLYSWLIALGMWIFPTNMKTELPLLRAVNFIVFLLALYAFGAWWRAIAMRTHKSKDPLSSVPGLYPAGWTVFGYALFVSAAAWYVGSVTPDLVVAAIVFATVILVLNLEDGGKHSVAAYAACGALMALGYYAKVILFYFGFLLLLALTIRHLRVKSYARPFVAALTFVALISPFAFLLSRSLGHFTIGETGRLNYAWLAGVPETITWVNGQPDSVHTPIYPGPRLHENPTVFGVPRLPNVTYAPWYDASRYDVRSRAHFDPRSQLRRIIINLKVLDIVVLQVEGSLLLALLILVLYAPRSFLRRLRKNWFYVIPTLMIVGMYALVFMTPRYLLAFLPLLWGFALTSVVVPAHLRDTVRPVILAGLIVFGLHVVPGFVHFLFSEDQSAKAEISIANELPAYGIRRGDVVATIGDGQSATWAQLAGVSIVGEIWSRDADKFWASSRSDQEKIVRELMTTGAKVIVWRRNSTRSCQLPWRSTGEFSGCILVPDGGEIFQKSTLSD